MSITDTHNIIYLYFFLLNTHITHNAQINFPFVAVVTITRICCHGIANFMWAKDRQHLANRVCTYFSKKRKLAFWIFLSRLPMLYLLDKRLWIISFFPQLYIGIVYLQCIWKDNIYFLLLIDIEVKNILDLDAITSNALLLFCDMMSLGGNEWNLSFL